MPGSAPAGASTNQPNASASVYTPTAQGGADTFYQSLLNPANPGSLGAAGANPGATPGGVAYNQAQPFVANNILGNPGQGSYLGGARQANNLGQGAYNLPLSAVPQLQGAAGGLIGAAPGFLSAGENLVGAAPSFLGSAQSILNTAMDPQQALYRQTQNQSEQQNAAANARSGLMGTPYGQSVADNANSNFNINWQSNLLNRMATGAGAATGLAGAAAGLSGAGTNLAGAATGLDTAGGNLYGQGEGLYGSGLGNLLSGSGAEYNANQAIGTNALGALGSMANLGNDQYSLPQQVLQDIQSYLGLGQAASGLSGSLGNLGQQQLGQQLGGYGSLLGSGLGLGTPSNPGYAAQGIGSLFGGGGLGGLGGLFGSTAPALTPGVGGAFATADFADLLPLAAAA